VHTHEWVEDKENSKAADCENDGYTAYKCKGCTETKKETIKALGHNYGEWKTTKEATTDSEGEKQRTCSRCNKVETQKIEKKKADSNSTVTNTVEAPSSVSEEDL
jgi:hypothetical protein